MTALAHSRASSDKEDPDRNKLKSVSRAQNAEFQSQTAAKLREQRDRRKSADTIVQSRRDLEELFRVAAEERNLYDVIFERVIEQVASHTRERGVLLSKIRAFYGDMFELVPKAARRIQQRYEDLHAEASEMRSSLGTSAERERSLQLELAAAQARLRQEVETSGGLHVTLDSVHARLRRAEDAQDKSARRWHEEKSSLNDTIDVLRKRNQELMEEKVDFREHLKQEMRDYRAALLDDFRGDRRGTEKRPVSRSGSPSDIRPRSRSGGGVFSPDAAVTPTGEKRRELNASSSAEIRAHSSERSTKSARSSRSGYRRHRNPPLMSQTQRSRENLSAPKGVEVEENLSASNEVEADENPSAPNGTHASLPQSQSRRSLRQRVPESKSESQSKSKSPRAYNVATARSTSSLMACGSTGTTRTHPHTPTGRKRRDANAAPSFAADVNSAAEDDTDVVDTAADTAAAAADDTAADTAAAADVANAVINAASDAAANAATNAAANASSNGERTLVADLMKTISSLRLEVESLRKEKNVEGRAIEVTAPVEAYAAPSTACVDSAPIRTELSIASLTKPASSIKSPLPEDIDAPPTSEPFVTSAETPNGPLTSPAVVDDNDHDGEPSASVGENDDTRVAPTSGSGSEDGHGGSGSNDDDNGSGSDGDAAVLDRFQKYLMKLQKGKLNSDGASCSGRTAPRTDADDSDSDSGSDASPQARSDAYTDENGGRDEDTDGVTTDDVSDGTHSATSYVPDVEESDVGDLYGGDDIVMTRRRRSRPRRHRRRRQPKSKGRNPTAKRRGRGRGRSAHGGRRALNLPPKIQLKNQADDIDAAQRSKFVHLLLCEAPELDALILPRHSSSNRDATAESAVQNALYPLKAPVSARGSKWRGAMHKSGVVPTDKSATLRIQMTTIMKLKPLVKWIRNDVFCFDQLRKASLLPRARTNAQSKMDLLVEDLSSGKSLQRYVYEIQHEKWGLRSLVVAKCMSIFHSTQRHRISNDEVDLFAEFLNGDRSTDELRIFLGLVHVVFAKCNDGGHIHQAEGISLDTAITHTSSDDARGSRNSLPPLKSTGVSNNKRVGIFQSGADDSGSTGGGSALFRSQVRAKETYHSDDALFVCLDRVGAVLRDGDVFEFEESAQEAIRAATLQHSHTWHEVAPNFARSLLRSAQLRSRTIAAAAPAGDAAAAAETTRRIIDEQLSKRKSFHSLPPLSARPSSRVPNAEGGMPGHMTSLRGSRAPGRAAGFYTQRDAADAGLEVSAVAPQVCRCVALSTFARVFLEEYRRAKETKRRQKRSLKLFRAVDANDDGFIDFAQFSAIFSRTIPSYTDRHAAELFANATRLSGTGELSSHGFVELCDELSKNGLRFPDVESVSLANRDLALLVVKHYTDFQPVCKSLYDRLTRSGHQGERQCAEEFRDARHVFEKELFSLQSDSRLINSYLELLTLIALHESRLRTTASEGLVEYAHVKAKNAGVGVCNHPQKLSAELSLTEDSVAQLIRRYVARRYGDEHAT